MTTLRVLIVDDEPLARRRLHLILTQANAGVDVVGQSDSCAAAIAAIAELDPQVVLLDIRMRDGTGFDVLDRLPPDRSPAVIFVTAFDDSAVRAFDVSAVDYLLKPVAAARLAGALDRARERLAQRDADERLAELRLVVANLREATRERGACRLESEFWIRGTGAALVRIDVADIVWIGVEDDYVRIHTEAGSALMRESLQGLHARLDPQTFVQIHRAAIVRLTAIERMSRGGGVRAEVVLRGGLRLQAGRVYSRALSKRLGRPPAAIATTAYS